MIHSFARSTPRWIWRFRHREEDLFGDRLRDFGGLQVAGAVQPGAASSMDGARSGRAQGGRSGKTKATFRGGRLRTKIIEPVPERLP